MANEEHLALLKHGVETWNEWRKNNPTQHVDLSGASLPGANLDKAKLSEANLTGANLGGANLYLANLRRANLNKADLRSANLGKSNLRGASLRGANLRVANLYKADLYEANLRGANVKNADLQRAKLGNTDLQEANITEANLSWAELTGSKLMRSSLNGTSLYKANLTGANLSSAILHRTQLVGTDISNANLTGSSIYGVSAWDLKMNTNTKQENLIITPAGEAEITVDNIKVAQFIYLLLNNEEIRDVFATITSKAVLILGRFSPERKIILDRLREELRTRHYLPILFDFEKAKSRDTIETIRILAGMSKFIVADLTEAKSVVQELQAIVPSFPSVPVRFIIMKSEREPAMFDHIRRFPWVLDGAFEYDNSEEVINSINDNILKPVEAKLKELSP
jgi:uncharacterized protein YjbI with pentapeptide repeats